MTSDDFFRQQVSDLRGFFSGAFGPAWRDRIIRSLGPAALQWLEDRMPSAPFTYRRLERLAKDHGFLSQLKCPKCGQLPKRLSERKRLAGLASARLTLVFVAPWLDGRPVPADGFLHSHPQRNTESDVIAPDLLAFCPLDELIQNQCSPSSSHLLG